MESALGREQLSLADALYSQGADLLRAAAQGPEQLALLAYQLGTLRVSLSGSRAPRRVIACAPPPGCCCPRPLAAAVELWISPHAHLTRTTLVNY